VVNARKGWWLLGVLFCLVQCGRPQESSTGTIQGGGASAGTSGSDAGGSDAGGSAAGNAGVSGAPEGGAAGMSGQGGKGGSSAGAGGQLIGNEDLKSCANSPALKDDRICNNKCIKDGCPEGESCCFIHCIRGCNETQHIGQCNYLMQHPSYFLTGCIPAKDCSPQGTIPPPPLDFCDFSEH
jgi:hypothetical protein